MRVDPLGGIGLDLERHDALDRFDRDALSALFQRWLTPDERRWCLARPRPARAAVELLCCKEAVYKAAQPHPPSLAGIAIHPPDVQGDDVMHAAAAAYGPGTTAGVAWTMRGAEVVAVAVVARQAHPRDDIPPARLAVALLRELPPPLLSPRRGAAPPPMRLADVTERTHRACYMHDETRNDRPSPVAAITVGRRTALQRSGERPTIG
jgi:phosphopantetheinyl transferase (holo-ACP synthase)